MHFTTENSTYEVDEANRRIRRLEGRSAPTPRQGGDGEWRSYLRLSRVVIGRPVVVVWDIQGDRLRATSTSPVETISGQPH